VTDFEFVAALPGSISVMTFFVADSFYSSRQLRFGKGVVVRLGDFALLAHGLRVLNISWRSPSM